MQEAVPDVQEDDAGAARRRHHLLFKPRTLTPFHAEYFTSKIWIRNPTFCFQEAIRGSGFSRVYMFGTRWSYGPGSNAKPQTQTETPNRDPRKLYRMYGKMMLAQRVDATIFVRMARAEGLIRFAPGRDSPCRLKRPVSTEGTPVNFRLSTCGPRSTYAARKDVGVDATIFVRIARTEGRIRFAPGQPALVAT